MRHEFFFVLLIFDISRGQSRNETFRLTKKCEKQWHNYRDEKCIKYLPVKVSYKDAKEFCAHEDAKLVSINTPDEDQFVESLARRYRSYASKYSDDSSRAWISARRLRRKSNIFVWPNGDLVSFARWGATCNDDNDCVILKLFDENSVWCDLNCNVSTADVICEKSLLSDTESSDLQPKKSKHQSCNSGWTHFRNKCVKLHNREVTGKEARSICEDEYNANVVSIHSEEEQKFLVNFLFQEMKAEKPVLIGLRRIHGEFGWVNHKIFNYSKWSIGALDAPSEDSKNCVVIQSTLQDKSNGWMEVDCESPSLLVCEKKTKQLKRTCSKGWENFRNEKCIKYIGVNINYNGAVTLCYIQSATLVSIMSAEEQRFIDDLVRKHLMGYGFDLAWIGATRPNHSFNKFVWQNGTFVEFAKWGNECPKSTEGANCVLLATFKDKPSIWCNHKCDSNYCRAICERPLHEE